MGEPSLIYVSSWQKVYHILSTVGLARRKRYHVHLLSLLTQQAALFKYFPQRLKKRAFLSKEELFFSKEEVTPDSWRATFPCEVCVEMVPQWGVQHSDLTVTTVPVSWSSSVKIYARGFVVGKCSREKRRFLCLVASTTSVAGTPPVLVTTATIGSPVSVWAVKV